MPGNGSTLTTPIGTHDAKAQSSNKSFKSFKSFNKSIHSTTATWYTSLWKL